MRRLEAHLVDLDPDERIRNHDHSTELDPESLAWDLKAIGLILEEAIRVNRRIRILVG